ncbi:hypothetical protein CCACVL1_21390 [Corchorus capsularis]|uniref:Uncharacterized protein n=1 Tax=Corchorus capsularis TaxID=210143 RepID=A0A1R3H646_COCAP|nr:hypothetical protein CCACVL1_21390 [Corchorus capsularis]
MAKDQTCIPFPSLFFSIFFLLLRSKLQRRHSKRIKPSDESFLPIIAQDCTFLFQDQKPEPRDCARLKVDELPAASSPK